MRLPQYHTQVVRRREITYTVPWVKTSSELQRLSRPCQGQGAILGCQVGDDDGGPAGETHKPGSASLAPQRVEVASPR